MKTVLGMRSFAFGLLSIIAAESVLLVIVWRVKEPTVIVALAPIVAGFFSCIGLVVGAVIVRHAVENLSTGGGVGGAVRSLLTDAKPGAPTPPPAGPGGVQ